jgi:hypothetical protein
VRFYDSFDNEEVEGEAGLFRTGTRWDLGGGERWDMGCERGRSGGFCIRAGRDWYDDEMRWDRNEGMRKRKRIKDEMGWDEIRVAKRS